MDTFEVPPEYCLIVRALGRTHSLREAASLLDCDPALLVRKVRKISDHYHLVQKLQGRWTLTEGGLRAAQWAEESISSQRMWLNGKPRLRIATTMWMAEQVLIPALPSLQKQQGDRLHYLFSTSSPQLERALLDGKADCVVACHAPTDPAIAHRRIAPERWVVIVPTRWSRQFPQGTPQQTIERLTSLPYIRHTGVNPEVTLGFSPASMDETLMDSLIGVRSAVESELGWGCVPELLVRTSLKHKQLAKVKLPVASEGTVCLWWLRARRDIGRHVKDMAPWLEVACAVSVQ